MFQSRPLTLLPNLFTMRGTQGDELACSGNPVPPPSKWHGLAGNGICTSPCFQSSAHLAQGQGQPELRIVLHRQGNDVPSFKAQMLSASQGGNPGKSWKIRQSSTWTQPGLTAPGRWMK